MNQSEALQSLKACTVPTSEFSIPTQRPKILAVLLKVTAFKQRMLVLWYTFSDIKHPGTSYQLLKLLYPDRNGQYNPAKIHNSSSGKNTQF